jgi:hypothetical protein
VNTDGSLNISSREAGSGFIIIDELGCFIAARCDPLEGVVYPFISELLASREGLEDAKRRGFATCKGRTWTVDKLKCYSPMQRGEALQLARVELGLSTN